VFREAASVLRIIGLRLLQGPPRAFVNHESAYLQRKPTSRYSDVRTSTFRGRAKTAAEAKTPARNRRAIGRTWAAWNWNDGTHETVDPGGIARLGIEAGYPRKLIFALPGTVQGTPWHFGTWRFRHCRAKVRRSKASDWGTIVQTSPHE
jgi:hypothetical protein